MNTEPIVTMEALRKVMQNLCANGQEVSNTQLFNVLGLTSEPEKSRMRRRIQDMVAHGEVTRIKDGIFKYNFKNRPRESHGYVKIWRFVRKQKPGWALNDAVLLTGVSYMPIRRYCSWLEEEGYIARMGKSKNTILFRATEKAEKTPETPYPPLQECDPFEKEYAAAAAIVKLMLCSDLYSKKTARSITAACETLMARFGNFKQVENETGGFENVQ